MQFQPGDYVCVDITTPGLGNWIADHAIRFFTHSKFCHTFIVADTNGTIIESIPSKGVHEGHIDQYKGMTMIGSSTQLSPKTRQGIVKSAYGYVGRTGYGFSDIAELALYTQGFHWNWLESEVAEETHRTICSQLAAMCGRENGVPEWMCGLPYPTLVTPANLANLAMA